MPKKCKLRPINDIVVIQQDEAITESPGGIAIAQTNQERPRTGVVLAVGPGKVNTDGTRTPLCVKVGERVQFSDVSGVNFDIDGDEYMLIQEPYIYAVIQ